MNIIETIKDRIEGKAPKGARRSSKWPKVRNKYLKNYPKCRVCGATKLLRVHHKMPFHLFPKLELEPNNLVTLCETKKYGKNCHLLFGHLGNFRRVNPNCEVDVMTWYIKLSTDSFALVAEYDEEKKQ